MTDGLGRVVSGGGGGDEKEDAPEQEDLGFEDMGAEAPAGTFCYIKELQNDGVHQNSMTKTGNISLGEKLTLVKSDSDGTSKVTGTAYPAPQGRWVRTDNLKVKAMGKQSEKDDSVGPLPNLKVVTGSTEKSKKKERCSYNRNTNWNMQMGDGIPCKYKLSVNSLECDRCNLRYCGHHASKFQHNCPRALPSPPSLEKQDSSLQRTEEEKRKREHGFYDRVYE